MFIVSRDWGPCPSSAASFVHSMSVRRLFEIPFSRGSRVLCRAVSVSFSDHNQHTATLAAPLKARLVFCSAVGTSALPVDLLHPNSRGQAQTQWYRQLLAGYLLRKDDRRLAVECVNTVPTKSRAGNVRHSSCDGTRCRVAWSLSCCLADMMSVLDAVIIFFKE